MAMMQPVDMAVKANQILARFRPIAPKPAALPTSPAIDGAAAAAANSVLRHLQSRPCRARKRGRPAVVPVSPSSAKRKRPVYPMPLRCAAATEAVVATAAHVSLAMTGGACMSSLPSSLSPSIADEEEEERDVPVERDLLRKLLEPKVISPRAVRPVGSTIRIGSVVIHHGSACTSDAATTRPAAASKTAGEVEAELEADALPAVVSDSSHRVRLVNDAYKAMVGAPECPWLGAVARRISGEVALLVPPEQPDARGSGFSCPAKIEWERGGGERACIHAACDVSRLQCDSRDYIYAWRFRTADAAPSSVSSHRTGDA